MALKYRNPQRDLDPPQIYIAYSKGGPVFRSAAEKLGIGLLDADWKSALR